MNPTNHNFILDDKFIALESKPNKNEAHGGQRLFKCGKKCWTLGQNIQHFLSDWMHNKNVQALIEKSTPAKTVGNTSMV